jgi:hypothetical protein
VVVFDIVPVSMQAENVSQIIQERIEFPDRSLEPDVADDGEVH